MNKIMKHPESSNSKKWSLMGQRGNRVTKSQKDLELGKLVHHTQLRPKRYSVTARAIVIRAGVGGRYKIIPMLFLSASLLEAPL